MPKAHKEMKASITSKKAITQGVKAKARGETLGPMPVSPQEGPHTRPSPSFSQATKNTCCTKRKGTFYQKNRILFTASSQ